MKVTKIIEKEINHCWNECPFFETESECMVCGHPYFKDKLPYANFIISHPDCDNGFPDECPLITGKNDA